ncbi:hypothetical protein B9G53_01085 [Pseudanabaena sp. SR411]|uniref:hypothetical protein n=1 Tax=Pseudanabaena sp. SR411 TaxID=1980935 RepID=UPI000B99AD30|nr:hypothetical protein [Pseudanabaena sp. SR411]OYQ67577.1 hypothetical protein B9G53_01085 [Pseudanabaena sp. SR411]
MTRHSTLTNPNDLHYAKVRSFSGDPANVSPEFPDQLIIASDTNKIYRATDTAQGAIVELEAGGGGGVVSFFPPESRPQKEGLFYFDQSQNQMYIAVANYVGDLWWKPANGVEGLAGFSATCSMLEDSGDEFISPSAFFTLFFSALSPSEIESAAYDFTRTFETDIQPLDTFDLGYWLNALGTGCYTFGYTADNPNEKITTTGLIDIGSGVPSGLELRTSPQVLTANNLPISNNYIYYTGQKVEGALEMQCTLFVVEVGG